MNRQGIGGKKGMLHTTGRRCDGCGRTKNEVTLQVVQRYEAGVTIPLTFCARCDRLDLEENGLAPRRLRGRLPPPSAPPPAIRLALGWTTCPILPRLRTRGSF